MCTYGQFLAILTIIIIIIIISSTIVIMVVFPRFRLKRQRRDQGSILGWQFSWLTMAVVVKVVIVAFAVAVVVAAAGIEQGGSEHVTSGQ